MFYPENYSIKLQKTGTWQNLIQEQRNSQDVEAKQFNDSHQLHVFDRIINRKEKQSEKNLRYMFVSNASVHVFQPKRVIQSLRSIFCDLQRQIDKNFFE